MTCMLCNLLQGITCSAHLDDPRNFPHHLPGGFMTAQRCHRSWRDGNQILLRREGRSGSKSLVSDIVNGKIIVIPCAARQQTVSPNWTGPSGVTMGCNSPSSASGSNINLARTTRSELWTAQWVTPCINQRLEQPRIHELIVPSRVPQRRLTTRCAGCG